MSDIRTRAFYFGPPAGRRYYALFEPAAPGRLIGGVLLAHGFAEEMNKCRRMAALQARRLAAEGWAALLVDLHGCGDSAGEFEDADWDGWIGDLNTAYAWLAEHTGMHVVLWGIRAGALLASAVAHGRSEPQRLLFWQPVVSGRQHLQQFLRTGAVSGVLSEQADAASTKELRRRLAAGERVEVAGYGIGSRLASGLEDATLLLPPPDSMTEWIEVAAAPGGGITPGSATCIGRWREAGRTVRERTVTGLPFWNTVEIAECPELIDCTAASLKPERRAS